MDAAAAALAFGFEGERRSRLWWLLPQRFAYRQLMYVVLVRSVLRAVKGELQSWGVLQRTGNVTTPGNKPGPLVLDGRPEIAA